MKKYRLLSIFTSFVVIVVFLILLPQQTSVFAATALGQACTWSSPVLGDSCDVNLVCVPVPGQPCTNGFGTKSCPGTCQPKPVTGACTKDSDCDSNSYCRTKVCTPRPAIGGSCTISAGAPDPCGANAACTNGTCQAKPKPAAGDACKVGSFGTATDCGTNNICDTSLDKTPDCLNGTGINGKVCSGTCKPKPTSGKCITSNAGGNVDQGICADGYFCNADPATCKSVPGLGTQTCDGECVKNGTPTIALKPSLPPPPSPPCVTWNNGKCDSVGSAFGALSTTPEVFIQTIFAILLSLSGGIALLLIMRAGYQMMLSQGKPEQLNAARDQLVAAIVGLVFLIFSFVLLQVIGFDILKIPLGPVVPGGAARGTKPAGAACDANGNSQCAAPLNCVATSGRAGTCQ